MPMKKIDVILPDLIILDIRLPRQSGISLYRQLKLNDNYRHVPVIFLSAFGIARNFISESFRKLVPDERVPEPELFLEKPVNIDLLLESIEDILARKGGAKTMSRQELQAEISTLMENVDKQKLAEILSVLKK